MAEQRETEANFRKHKKISPLRNEREGEPEIDLRATLNSHFEGDFCWQNIECFLSGSRREVRGRFRIFHRFLRKRGRPRFEAQREGKVSCRAQRRRKM